MGRKKAVWFVFYLAEMLRRVYVRVVITITVRPTSYECVCACVSCVFMFPDEYKSELGQQLSLIAGSLVGGVCIVSLIAIAIICARYRHTHTHTHTLQTSMAA